MNYIKSSAPPNYWILKLLVKDSKPVSIRTLSIVVEIKTLYETQNSQRTNEKKRTIRGKNTV